MLHHLVQNTKNGADAITGSAMLSSPLWLKWIEEGFAWYMMIGGAILLSVRLYLAYHEWKSNKESEE